MSRVKFSRNPLRFRAAVAAALGAGLLPALAHAGLQINLSTTAGLTAPPTTAQNLKYLTADTASVPVYVYATVTGTAATDFQGVQYAYYNVDNSGFGGTNQVAGGSVTTTAMGPSFGANGSLGGQIASTATGITVGSTTSLDYSNETPGGNGTSPAKARSGNAVSFSTAGASKTFLLETLTFTPSQTWTSGSHTFVPSGTSQAGSPKVTTTLAPDAASLAPILAANGLQDALWFQDSTSSSAPTADSTTGAGYNSGAATVGSVPVTFENTLVGDANGDGTCNAADLQVLASNLNLAGTWSTGDFNHDGTVNAADLQLLASNLNLGPASPQMVQSLEAFAASLGDEPAMAAGLAANPLFASAVPEPASVAILGLGAVSLLWRRRRAGGAPGTR